MKNNFFSVTAEKNKRFKKKLILLVSLNLFFLVMSIIMAIFGMTGGIETHESFATYPWLGIGALVLFVLFIISSVLTFFSVITCEKFS